MRATGIIDRAGLSGSGTSGPVDIDARHADAVGGAVTERKAAAGEPDPAQHRRQHDRRPVRLLAVMRTLQRPGAGDHAAGLGGAASELANGVGRNAGDRGRPVRVFCRAVVETQEVAAERLEPDAMARDELRIVAGLVEQRVRHRQHQRGIGVGADRDPLRAKEIGRIGAQRTDRDELDPGVAGAAQPSLQAMNAGPAGGDLAVLGGEPAERNHQPGMLDDR